MAEVRFRGEEVEVSEDGESAVGELQEAIVTSGIDGVQRGKRWRTSRGMCRGGVAGRSCLERIGVLETSMHADLSVLSYWRVTRDGIRLAATLRSRWSPAEGVELTYELWTGLWEAERSPPVVAKEAPERRR